MDQAELNGGLARDKMKVKCTPLKIIPEICDQDGWSPCPSPKEPRPCNTSGRSRSLPGSVALGLPLPGGGGKYAETIRASAATRSEREMRILVLGYTGGR
ncbi:hypothetical protein LSH36_355g04010 [Paralvinella palmiformis]|uniref:Uncharacterized protein n=1 Tax=Paralvinella palmiformis TaxID=53620 RepID=A0AAD9JGD6_9ANNE|nr:hypothetical protein LSH36_355g04010 [Paralvinella palmiformis]